MIDNKLSVKDAIKAALSSGVPIKYRELRRISKSSQPIKELVESGEIERLGMGLYGLPKLDNSWDSFANLSTAFPNAVICLASAAAYHGLTTQNPYEVWAAFPYNQTVPRNTGTSIRGFRWKDKSMSSGIDIVEIGGAPVRMTSAARTVVDFLRSMNRTGETEVAMEALGNFQGKMSDVLKIARELGAEKTVRPYIQAAQGMGRTP